MIPTNGSHARVGAFSHSLGASSLLPVYMPVLALTGIVLVAGGTYFSIRGRRSRSVVRRSTGVAIALAGLVTTIVACSYIVRATTPHDGFERTFGPEWTTWLSPEQEARMLQRRYTLFWRPREDVHLVQDAVIATLLGTGRELLAGETPPLAVVADRSTAAGRTALTALEMASGRLLGAVETAEISAGTYAENQRVELEGEARRAYLLEAVTAAVARWSEPPLTVAVERARGEAAAEDDGGASNGFVQSSPGMIVQFAIFGLITSAMILVLERKSRALSGERIAAIRAPTLIVHATGDTLQLYDNAEFAAATIPDACLRRFERGGHLLMVVEQPASPMAVQGHILAHATEG